MSITLKDILASQGNFWIKTIKFVDFIVGGLVAFFLPAVQEKSFIDNKIKTILIIRPGGIGDAVFMLPFLRNLKKQYENIYIDILCEKRNREVFCAQEDLCLSVSCYDSGLEFFSVFKKKYDVIVDAEQWHYLTAIVSYFVKAKHKIGFATRTLRKKLFHCKAVYKNDIYELDNFKELFRPILREDLLESKLKGSFVASQRNQKESLGEYVALGISGSIPARQLSSSQIQAIVHFFLGRNLTVVLLGSHGSGKPSKEIEKSLQDARVVNLIEKTSLSQAAEVISLSKVFVGTDSGLLHIAVALGIPTLSIFGPGNLKKWFFEDENNIAIKKDMGCSPCTHFGYTVPTCQGRYSCIRDIGCQEIPSFLEKIIKRIV